MSLNKVREAYKSWSELWHKANHVFHDSCQITYDENGTISEMVIPSNSEYDFLEKNAWKYLLNVISANTHQAEFKSEMGEKVLSLASNGDANKMPLKAHLLQFLEMVEEPNHDEKSYTRNDSSTLSEKSFSKSKLAIAFGRNSNDSSTRARNFADIWHEYPNLFTKNDASPKNRPTFFYNPSLARNINAFKEDYLK